MCSRSNASSYGYGGYGYQQQQPNAYSMGYAHQSYAPQQQQQYYNNYNAGYAGSYGQGQPTAPFPVEGYTQHLPSFDLSRVQLPQPNLSCYSGPQLAQGATRYVRHQPQSESKCINQSFNINKTAVKENVVHHQHQKNVIINVNRNHNHMLKVINKDSNYHHHLINNIVKVNDIHHQKIEQVRGEGRVLKDYKQVNRVETPVCRRGNGNSSASMQSPLPPPALSYSQPQEQHNFDNCEPCGQQQQQEHHQYEQHQQQPSCNQY